MMARIGAKGAARRRHGLIDTKAAFVAVAGAQHRRLHPGQSLRRCMLALCRWAFHSRRRVVHSPAAATATASFAPPFRVTVSIALGGLVAAIAEEVSTTNMTAREAVTLGSRERS